MSFVERLSLSQRVPYWRFHCIVHTQHITGLRLLKLDEDALKLIGIKDSFRQQSILYGIQELKEADFNTPRNFYEYKVHTTFMHMQRKSDYFTLHRLVTEGRH